MMRIYLFFAAVIFSINANAQAPDWLWAKGIIGAGSVANSITADGYGNLYTTGYFSGTIDFDPGVGVFNLISSGGTVGDIFICKTDSLGNFIWAKGIGGPNVDVGQSIAFDLSGNGAVYISGFFKGTADFDPNAGVFNLVSVTPAYNDIFICKLDTAGNLIWAKGMGGMDDDGANSISVDPSGSGNIYCTGIFRNISDFDPNAGIFNLTSAGDNDIFISKYNSSGNLVWAKRMGGVTNDEGMFIARNPAGNTDVYTAGNFSGTVDFDPGTGSYPLITAGGDDIFISKLDSAGNFVWAKAMGGPAGDYANSIAVDISGKVYTTGFFAVMADFDPGAFSYVLGASGYNDFFISKLDSSGNFVWAKAIGGGVDEYGYDIVVDYSGNTYTIGDFRGTVDFDPGIGVSNITAGFFDFFLLKLDSTGNFNWVIQVGGTNNEHVHSLVLDPTGHLSMTGIFTSSTIAFGTNYLFTGGIFIARLDTILAVGIETIYTDQFPIIIFPNPFTDELTVNSSKPGDIKIYDVCGRIVYTETLFSFNTQRITANWQKGIYFVEIITNEGRAVKKVVKH